MNSKHIAIYVRVSSVSQTDSSQIMELQLWAKNNCKNQNVVWYKDTFTGTTMKRPAMNKLMEAVLSGKISSIVLWRLDRAGRTAKGLVSWFDTLLQRNIGLISIKDSLDLSTPAGRLMANVLASVAAFETEVRKERQMAGIRAAKKAGKRWGGSSKGRKWKVTPDHEQIIKQMKLDGKSIAAISRITKLSRPTIYKVLSTSQNK